MTIGVRITDKPLLSIASRLLAIGDNLGLEMVAPIKVDDFMAQATTTGPLATALDIVSAKRMLPTAGGIGGDGVIVSQLDYSHFPSATRLGNGCVISVYYRGSNHGQRAEEAIATIQMPTLVLGVYTIALDGDEASGGTVTLATPSDIFINVRRDESGKNFTVVGTDAFGAPQTITFSGPQTTNPFAPNFRRRYTGRLWLTITSITVSAITTAEVNVGRLEAASDVAVSYTFDEGQSWGRKVLSNGMEHGDRRSYWTTCGTAKDGSGIVLYFVMDIATGIGRNYHRMTRNGIDYTDEVAVEYVGFPAGVGAEVPLIQYTPIQARANGELVTILFSGGKSWLATSTAADAGKKWTARAQIADCAELGSLDIIAVNTGAKTFTVAGDQTALVAAGQYFGVANASANNGFYKATNVALVGGNTVITVAETIITNTVAGRLRSVTLSEWALALVTDRDWYAISRVSGVVSAMAQFKSNFSGSSWDYLGSSGLQVSGGWISPCLGVQRLGDKTWVSLALFERNSASAPPAGARWLTVRSTSARQLLDGEGWGRALSFKVAQDFSASFVRSGYPIMLLEQTTGEALFLWGRETTKTTARIEAFRANIADKLPGGRIGTVNGYLIDERELAVNTTEVVLLNLEGFNEIDIDAHNIGHTAGSNSFIILQFSPFSNGVQFEGTVGDWINDGGGGGTTSYAACHAGAIAANTRMSFRVRIRLMNDPARRTSIASQGAVAGTSTGNGNVIAERSAPIAHLAMRIKVSAAGDLLAGSRWRITGRV